MIPYLIDKDFDLQRLVDADGKLIVDSNGLDIYVQNPAPSVPTDHGVGVLYDTTFCKATHELNGEDEIELRYPVDGALFDKLELRAVIVARVDRVRGNQPYRIYRITKPLHGIVTVYARHLAYDLAGIVVEPFSATTITAALAGLKSHAMTNCPFTFSTTRTTTAAFGVNVPSSIWSLMGGQRGSLLDVYGGEYTFDGYNITLENHVGSDRGVSVRYGVNMTDLEQDANCENCYTGVVAYWHDNEGFNEIHSPVVSASGTYGYVRVLSVDMSQKWENKPTLTQLTNAAATYITANQIGIPKVSWKIGFIPLDQTEEYKDIAALEQVSLGDTVTVKFSKLGVDASARVRRIEWNVLLDRYISVELGSIKSNIADTVATQGEQITQRPTTDEVEKIALIVAHKIVADYIEANYISANHIRGGTLNLGSEENVSGVIDLFDSDNNFFGKLYNAGMWFGDGNYSALQNHDGYFVRRVVDGVVHNLISMFRVIDGTTANGALQLASVASDGTTTINAYITGDGSISCKRLWVNGTEIIP